MSRIEMSNLIKAIARALNELDELQYQHLLEGKGRIKFIGLGEREKGKRSKQKRSNRISLTDSKIQSLATELRECRTREEALELVDKDGREILRESLVRLAKLLQVYVTKSDKNNIIKDKIVESVVGVRLRTEAIRGLNFKS